MKQLIFLIIVFFSCHLWQLGFGQSNLTDQTSVKAHQQLLSNQSSLFYGDSNCDGQLDILDVVATINHILGLNPDPYCIHLADLNADGEINILDVVFTINLILEVPGLPCPGLPTITDFDGNIYNTVLIGEQCWMKENLKASRDAAGNSIARYCYENNLEYCDWYGGLYDWFTAMNGEVGSNTMPSGVQGICPEGWHLPSHFEWTKLEQYVCVALGNTDCDFEFPYDHTTQGLRGTNEGNALKSCRQVDSPLGGACSTTEHPRWNSHTTQHGFDEVGFSALPGGRKTVDFGDLGIGSAGYWWSTSEQTSDFAWYRYIYFNGGKIARMDPYKTLGFSIRCLRD